MSQAAPLLTGVAAFPSPELALSSGRRFEVRFWQQARCGADVPLQELEDLMPPHGGRKRAGRSSVSTASILGRSIATPHFASRWAVDACASYAD
jgi:hypothetical protein